MEFIHIYSYSGGGGGGGGGDVCMLFEKLWTNVGTKFILVGSS